MARNIGADGRRVYRAVIVQTDQRRDGKSGTRYEGPYDSPGAARARVTFWRNYWDAYDDGSSATGHIEQAHTVWTPVDGEQPATPRPTPGPDEPRIVVTVADVEAALRNYLAHLDYDLHKSLASNEESGADTYPDEAADLFDRLAAAAKESDQ
ncbi:MAG: hypothetical protein HOQ43_06785 [Glycomyces artemisiae]|uniref:Uncharacterized protein n=1 Tax=Glycomyces artemisiae TaxID=1076443 RepID=A0A850C903_9ACTN|nr:hypothetical protein [Glycomyces artemisiae]